MIIIKSQTAVHQYDDQGRIITTWDNKKCSWIVNTEFENEDIDWYGKDSDFPAGYTLAEYIEQNPNWDKMPNIIVTWTWNDKETCIRAFGQPHSFGERPDYWDKVKYPYTASKDWGYLDYSKETAIEQLGKYCNFHIHADKTIIKYNNEIIFEGKL